MQVLVAGGSSSLTEALYASGIDHKTTAADTISVTDGGLLNRLDVPMYLDPNGTITTRKPRKMIKRRVRIAGVKR